ncbi:MAG TPA: polymorphic toxin-type HINT domain-containing protein, partial [Isosphaeraceae bacterium]|nr:polymorphic toxin-type HINT domain-containing protein [Isosphaeraceae bacterium]
YGYVGFDPNGLPVVARGVELRQIGREDPARREADLEQIEARTAQMIVEANLKALDSQRRLAVDIAEIEAANASNGPRNGRIAEVLRAAAGAPDLPSDDEDAWHRWYYDKVGYSYDPPPQVILAVNASPQPSPPSVMSCFTANTPVRTRAGRRPIESLRVGDEVLSQDVTTGALGFRTITAVHRNPPGPILLVALDDGDVLRPSIYHRFWLAGRGWAMARELRPGDAIRTLGGRAKVVSVTGVGAEPLFNLDVAGSRTFFVGEHDALVHDNTLPDPRPRPFDADVP